MLSMILIAFAACLVMERAMPGWQLPRVRTWPLRVLLINAVQLSVVMLAGVTWERWLSSWSLFHLARQVPPMLGGLIAYFVATFVFYWWHRWRHDSAVLPLQRMEYRLQRAQNALTCARSVYETLCKTPDTNEHRLYQALLQLGQAQRYLHDLKREMTATRHLSAVA